MKNIVLILILFSIASCGRESEKKYFETGQIKEERIYEHNGDTSIYLLLQYCKSGNLLSKGYIKDGKKEGVWKEWYCDGSNKWKGLYANNIRKNEIDTLSTNTILISDSLFRKDSTTYIKVWAYSIHPNDVLVGCNNGIIKVSDNRGNFDFMIKPAHTGDMMLTFYTRINGQVSLVGEKIFNVTE